MSTYGDTLAKVGLTPDNPDAMYAQLMMYIAHPVDFKNADRCWPGARDAKIAWEDPKGTIALQWPFGGGKWLDNAPKNEAQVRAVYKVPAGQDTRAFLFKLYRVTSPLTKYRVEAKAHGCAGGGGFGINVDLGGIARGIQSGVQSAVNVANTLHIPGVNLTTAILTGKNPLDALKADLNSFAQAGAIAKGVVSGDMGPLTKAATDAAKSVGVTVDPKVAANIVAAAQSGDATKVAAAALGPNYDVAWKLATNGGAIFDAGLPAPPGLSYLPGAVANGPGAVHPLTEAVKAQPVTAALLAKQPLQVPVDRTALAAHLGVSPAHPVVAGAPATLKVDKPWLHVGVGGGLGVVAGTMLGAATVATGGLAAAGAAAGYGAWKLLRRARGRAA